MGTKEIAYMRWTADEYRHVAANALGFMDQGLPLIQAFRKGQVLALPRKRHRSTDDLIRCTRTGTNPVKRYAEEMRALSPEQLAPFLAPPRPEPEAKPKAAAKPLASPTTGKRVPKFSRDDGTRVDWLTREKALMARATQPLLEAGDTRSLAMIYNDVQRSVLPKERWRASSGLYAANHTGTLKKTHAEGLAAIWMLKDEPAASLAEEVTGSDAVDLQSAGAVLQRAAEGEAPQVAPPVSSGLAGAGQAFADAMHAALGNLLQAHAQHLLGQLEQRTESIANGVALAMAAQIQQGLRQTVHQLIAAELGPVAAPEAPAPAAPGPSVPVTASSVKRLKFDVVGFEQGSHEQDVLRGLNGHKELVDINFVHPDKMTTYAPHKGRSVILVVQKVSHTLRHKIKAAGVEPIYVKRTPGHVVHAIEAACDAAAAPAH